MGQRRLRILRRIHGRTEGCDAFVDTVGRHCLAKTAYHAGDADGVKQVLERLVGGRLEVETYVNGPKPFVWLFRVAGRETTWLCCSNSIKTDISTFFVLLETG